MNDNHNNVKHQIKKTVFELISEMNVEKINVAMITKKCGISRTLFYYYYEDIYALLEDILSIEIENVMQECIHIENPQDAIFHYISWWKERFFIIRKLLGTKYYEPAEILIRNIHQKYIRQVFDTKVDIPMKAKDINFMMEFMAAGLTTFFLFIVMM